MTHTETPTTLDTWQRSLCRPHGKVESRKQHMETRPRTTLLYSQGLSTHSSSRWRTHGVPLAHSGRPSAGEVQLSPDTPTTTWPGSRGETMAGGSPSPPATGSHRLLPLLQTKLSLGSECDEEKGVLETEICCTFLNNYIYRGF